MAPLDTGKLRLEEVWYMPQGHMATHGQNRYLDPGLPDSGSALCPGTGAQGSSHHAARALAYQHPWGASFPCLSGQATL